MDKRKNAQTHKERMPGYAVDRTRRSKCYRGIGAIISHGFGLGCHRGALVVQEPCSDGYCATQRK